MFMPLKEAAEYLAERGFEVSRRRVGGRGAPTADTLKHWIRFGKIKGHKAAKTWFVTRKELDKLIAKAQASTAYAAPAKDDEA